MGSFKITLHCLLISLPAIAGLSCLKCEDYFFDADAQAVKYAIKLLKNITETPACRDPVDNKATTLPLEQCSWVTGGLANACYFRILSASISGGGKSFEFTYTQRGCRTILESNKDTCEGNSASNLLDTVNAEGNICYCSTDKCNEQTKLIPALAVLVLSVVAFCLLKE